MKIEIGLTEQQRQAISEGLAVLLADTYTLYLKTHYFHWNVTGPHFQSLHALFEGQYNELWLSVDTIAERIRALGFPAPGSYSQFAHLTHIKEDTGTLTWSEMVAQLVQGHEIVAKTARSLLALVEEAHDEVTLGLLAARMEVHEKSAWMLRSIIA